MAEHHEKHTARLQISLMIGAIIALLYVFYKDSTVVKGGIIAGLIGTVVAFAGLTLYESHGNKVPGGYGY